MTSRCYGDMHVVFKQGMKEIAAQHGKVGDVHAEAVGAEVGSSCHIHISLWRGGKNVFWDAETRRSSQLFRQFRRSDEVFAGVVLLLCAAINSTQRLPVRELGADEDGVVTRHRTVGFRVVGRGTHSASEEPDAGRDANLTWALRR